MAGRSRGVVIPISAEDNSARAFESVNAQVAKLRAQVASMRGQGGSDIQAVTGLWHSQTTEVQATSAAIRSFEGNPGIRSIERFLVMLPGVGKALLAAFPLVGALALGGVIAQNVKKFVEMRDAAIGAADATRKAFQEEHDKAVVALDDTQQQNDKLQEQIDKLEGHHNNGLQSALDDAKKSCDQLIVTLDDAKKSYMELLKTNSTGMFGALFSGMQSTGAQEGQLSGTYDTLIAKARELNTSYLEALSGAKDPAAVNALAAQRVKQIHDLYDPQIAAMSAEAKRLQVEQAGSQQRAMDNAATGAEGYTPVIDNSKKIANVQGAGQIFAEQEAQQLADVQHASLQGTLNEHHSSHAGAAGSDKAAAYAARVAEAQQKVAEAESKASDQAAAAGAAAAKNRSDAALAALEDQHKRELVSDKDYYAQKLALQKDALDAEEAANYAKQGVLGEQIRSTIIKRGGADKGNAVAQINDNAKIVEFQTQVNELEQKRADIVDKRKKLEEQSDAEAYASAQKQEEAALKLAAQVEAIRGGSTTARVAQSDATYARSRSQMVVQGAPAGEIANADYQHSVANAGIGLSGAENTQRNTDSSLSTARESVRYQAASGQISQMQAQQELIALDKQEADALQPVLAAYEKLAALNVNGAAEHVAQLKQQMTELNAPVNELAATVRGQLNGAFEELFMNLGRGGHAWDQLRRQIQASALQDTYKMAIAPMLQTGMGALGGLFGSHGAPGAPGAPGTAKPTAASALGGLFSKVVPGLPKIAGGSGTAAKVTIINQSSTPVQGSATSAPQQDMTDQLNGPVIQIMLKDLESSGPFAQALSGAGLLA